MTRAVRFAGVAFATSMVVLALKAAAWWYTGSAALLADGAESALDVVTSLLLVLAVRLSSKPADAGHPWGHGKVEYFTVSVQGALVSAAGVSVLIASVRSLAQGVAPTHLMNGLVLSTVATALNLLLAVTLVYQGRRLRSPALEADGHHNLADVITTVGGWTGLGLAWLTDLWLLDPIVGVLIAVHVLWTGVRLLGEAVSGLMDASIPEEELAPLLASFDHEIASVLGARYDQLRARRSSDTVFVECTLYVPGDTTVTEGHALCDRLELQASDVLPGAVVHIHLEPA